MPESLAEATAAAKAEQRKYLEMQDQALNAEPADRPAPGDVLAQAKAAELAQARIEVARRREEDAAEDARLAAQHAIGARAIQLAAAASAPSAEHVAAVRQLAELATAIRARAGTHDAAVRGLYDEASELHGDPRHDPLGRTGQRGQWVPHMAPMGVKYGYTEVHVIGGAVDQAIGAAVKGDVDGALKLLTPVKDHTPPQPDYWLRDTLNQFPPDPVFGRLHKVLAEGVREGRYVRMTEPEVAAWQASRQ